MHYHTSIKRIMSSSYDYARKCGRQPIFLSDWDVDAGVTNCPHFDYSVYEKEDRPYYYWTDEGCFRSIFTKFYTHTNP